MRTVYITDIIEQSKILTDTKYSTHTTDEELYILLAKAYRDLYNIMTTKDESLFLNTLQLAPVGGIVDLPDDFYKTIDIYELNGEFRHPLNRTLIRSQGQSQSICAYPTYTIIKNTLKFTPKNFNRAIWLDYLPLPVDMNFKATGIIGDGELTPTITFTSKTAGVSGNQISVTLVAGGIAGSEVVTVTGSSISVSISDGVSTVVQVKAALDSSLEAYSLITTTSTIVGALSAGTVNLAGGAESFDCVCNEDDFLSAYLAEIIAIREESDSTKYTEMKNSSYANILNFLSPRDNASTVIVRDVETSQYFDQYPRNLFGRR